MPNELENFKLSHYRVFELSGKTGSRVKGGAVVVRAKQDSGRAKQDKLCGKAGQRIRGAS
jgi:hypothetical protein